MGSYRRSNRSHWNRQLEAAPRKYPELPPSPIYPTYSRIIGPTFLSSVGRNRVHVQDYSDFVQSIVEAEQYRLPNRLRAQKFDWPEPVPPAFPDQPTAIELKRPPAPPHWLARMLYTTAFQKAEAESAEIERFNQAAIHANAKVDEWRRAKQAFDFHYDRLRNDWFQAAQEWDRSAQRDQDELEALSACYTSEELEGLQRFFTAALHAVPLPSWCPHDYSLRFDCASNLLLVEVTIPHLESFFVWKNGKSGKQVHATKAEAAATRKAFSFLIPLRLMWEVAHVDSRKFLSLIACNVSVVFNDPATGRIRKDTIMSVVSAPDALRQINLSMVSPEACFRSLKGIVAPNVLDYVPVAPLIHFDLDDERFIENRSVLEHLGEQNLATMDWQDFEHLVREAMEKEFGGTVKVTQASRDRGVDAIAFDADPVKGGKYIIQAKRYTNTVDVSAVRDLFGAVMAEGANRGILVTTSHFGPDAYEFARDKPLSLLTGENLLHLLKKHGYACRIDFD